MTGLKQCLEQLGKDLVAERARDVAGAIGGVEHYAGGLCCPVGIDRIDVRQAGRLEIGIHAGVTSPRSSAMGGAGRSNLTGPSGNALRNCTRKGSFDAFNSSGVPAPASTPSAIT